MPPVTSGPGLILPDSPLFFLDQLKQNVKVALAFSPEKKAEVRAQIAGERLAELRIMLHNDDQDGINDSLNQLTREMRLASESLSEASSEGKNVQEIAMDINTTIKEHRRILQTVEDQTSGELQSRFSLADDSLRDTKFEVEDELPEDELNKEIEEAIFEEIENEVDNAEVTSSRLERALAVLQEQASKSAQSDVSRREAALKRAIENKNVTARRLEERRLRVELEKQGKLSEEQKKAAVEVRKASESVGKAAEQVRESKKRVQELRNQESQADDSEADDIDEGDVEDTDDGQTNNSGTGSTNSGKSEN